LRSLPDALLIENTSLEHLDVSLNRDFALELEGSGDSRIVLRGLKTLVCGFVSHRIGRHDLLLATHLMSVSLHGNSLSSLPWETARLGSLVKLSLDWNALSDLPCSLALCSALQYIYLAGNRLSQVPPCLTCLTVRCQFTRLLVSETRRRREMER